MIETNKIINGNCIDVMKDMPEGCIDLVVTSPPYGVGINYDVHDDDMEFTEYQEFSKDWLTQAYRILKDDGRIAVNIPYEINRQAKGGRIFMVAEVWKIMQEIGFGFFGFELPIKLPHLNILSD
jgi:site-specific DNA-methyltransferase (adenine-specific)